MPKIKSGYVLTARNIQEKKIAHSPPHFREVWNYLYREANHKDNKYGSRTIKRGQLFRSYKDIQKALSWYVGYRKHSYSLDNIKKAMKALREYLMIASTKAPGGVLITILNYNHYQNPKNYESTNESTNESQPKAPPIITRNDKNDKNKEKIIYPVFLDKDLWLEFKKMRIKIKATMTPYAEQLAINKLNRFVEQGYNPTDIINQSIMNSWKGLFPIKDFDLSSPPNRISQDDQKKELERDK